MVKYIGILLVSGAISLYGAHLAAVRTEKAKMRGELLELLARIKNGIDNGALPLADIYAGFHGETLEKRGFCTVLKSGVPDAFSKALAGVKKDLPEECAANYAALAAVLGKSGCCKTESAQIARYSGILTALEARYAKDDAAKCVLYRKLGALCGLFAALILL